MPALSSLTKYIPAATTLASGLINRNAAGKATNALTGGVNKAIDTVNAGAGQARRTLADVYNEQKGLLDPYRTAGMPATNSLAEGVLPGGRLVKPFGNTEFDLYKDPSYQWRIQQGQRAIEAGANAGGIRFSGATLKALSGYNQQEGSKEWAAANQRFQETQQNEYDRLMGVSNIGQNATNTEVQAGGTYGSNLSNLEQSTAAQVAGLQTDLASAQAAGDVAKANTITDTIDKLTTAAGLAGRVAPAVAGGAGASLAAVAGGAVPAIPLGATSAATASTAGFGALGVTPGAASGGGLGATLGALASNPFTWVAAGAIGGALLLHHFVGQGRKSADQLTHPSTGPNDPGGMQWGFEQTLKTIDATPNQAPADKWAAKEQAYQQLVKLGTEFAKKGSKQKLAAKQMFDSLSHLFGERNPLR